MFALESQWLEQYGAVKPITPFFTVAFDVNEVETSLPFYAYDDPIALATEFTAKWGISEYTSDIANHLQATVEKQTTCTVSITMEEGVVKNLRLADDEPALAAAWTFVKGHNLDFNIIDDLSNAIHNKCYGSPEALDADAASSNEVYPTDTLNNGASQEDSTEVSQDSAAGVEVATSPVGEVPEVALEPGALEGELEVKAPLPPTNSDIVIPEASEAEKVEEDGMKVTVSSVDPDTNSTAAHRTRTAPSPSPSERVPEESAATDNSDANKEGEASASTAFAIYGKEVTLAAVVLLVAAVVVVLMSVKKIKKPSHTAGLIAKARKLKNL